MAELKEVFEMVTKQTEPDLDSWRQQEARQRRVMRNRRVGALALVAAVIAALVVAFVTARPDSRTKVAHSPSRESSASPFVTTPPIGPQVVGLDGSPIQQVPGSFGGAEGVALSPDGTTIAYMILGNVWVVRADGTGDRPLTDGNTNAGDAQNHVSWSPDGSKLAYAWDGEIYVMNANGSGKQRLTDTPSDSGSYFPVWSPDGSTIAFWRGSGSGRDGGPSDAEIYTVPVTGGDPTRLTNDDAPDIEPTWSPDGARIAFRHGDALRVMRADGSGPHDIGFFSFGPWAPAWSPDGEQIAFLVYDPSQRSITNAPLLEVRVLNLAANQTSRLHIRVETDGNGPTWVTNDTLLVNRYD